MDAVIKWIEALFGNIPLPLLEVWGRLAYIVGFALMLLAYLGLTLRPGGRWGLGWQRQNWDAKALQSMLLTFVLVLGTGYVGSFIVLVPGAQTFESLKDLSVFVCVLLFGYPALLMVPVAYGLSDLNEGVPPAFLLDWLPGYFINPACFWIASQLFGKDPDFRRAGNWLRYAAFVLLFMALEPQLWGDICSPQFTADIAFRTITPALWFTTGITWMLAPLAMLLALPLARRLGLFWADIPGHVMERELRRPVWLWESGKGLAPQPPLTDKRGVPVRVLIVTPFVTLVLLLVGTTAYKILRSAEADALKLAGRLHEEMSDNINLRLDSLLASPSAGGNEADRLRTMSSLLASLPIARYGRALVVDEQGRPLASTLSVNSPADPVSREAVAALALARGEATQLSAPLQFHFDVLTAKPLMRASWLAQATPYQDNAGGHNNWVLVTAMPASYYLSGVQTGSSQTALVTAWSLVLALSMAAVLAATVTAPIQRLARATQAMARGDLTQRVHPSPLTELDALSSSFNFMAEQLTKYQERTQLAGQALGIGVWDWNILTNELVWDDQMYCLYGIRREDFSGAYSAWEQRVSPEDFDRTVDALKAAVRGEKEYACEFRVVWPDGTVRYLQAAGMTIRDAKGQALRMVGSNHDITARKQAEEEIRKLNAELESRVRDRTAQLERVNQELAGARDAAEAATHSKSEFLANMSHEIRTPMNAVLGMTDLALRTELDDKQRFYVSKTKVAAESLLGIIDDILDFSKIEAGKLDLEQRPFQLSEVLERVQIIVGHKAQEKGLDLTMQVAPDVPARLKGDPLRLAQVLINLCNNAIKFTEHGRVTVRVARAARPSSTATALHFTVHDTGIGMSSEQTMRLFQPFSQADTSTTRKYGGTGLGLAICQKLVTLMGGHGLSVTSALGQGSTFGFDALFDAIPGTSDPSDQGDAELDFAHAAANLPEKEVMDKLKGLRVLLVEDNEINQMVAEGLLADVAEVRLRMVANGQQALDALQAETFDLVLTDVQMPVMDGYETTRRIRAIPELANLPIVAMTAHAMLKDRERCLAAGMNDYVIKPFNPGELFSVLARWAPAPVPT